MTGNYGPAAAAAAASAAGNTVGRTVFVGDLPSDASVDELLNLVRFGPIEKVKIYLQRPSVFISFMDGSTAAAFHADASVKKLALHGQQLRIGWGKASYPPKYILKAVQLRSATRNVFLGDLPPDVNEQDLRDLCCRFGDIDQVKIVRNRNCGFVHFLSIAVAIRVSRAALHPACLTARSSSNCPMIPTGGEVVLILARYADCPRNVLKLTRRTDAPTCPEHSMLRSSRRKVRHTPLSLRGIIRSNSRCSVHRSSVSSHQ